MNLLRLLTSPIPVPASWYAMPLRLIVGFGFIQHGYAKLARGPEDFIGVLHAMGLPSASQDMKLTCFIWLAFLRCALEDRGRFRLTTGSTALWGNIVWLVVNHRR
jgi:uncharacterized membrane protein YphA (DoxX/SURF4 family)